MSPLETTFLVLASICFFVIILSIFVPLLKDTLFKKEKGQNYSFIKEISKIAVFCFIICIICLLAGSVYQYEVNKQVECNKYKGTCEYYKCWANNENTYFAQNNYLLRYQNCLLEKQNGKETN